MINWASFMSIDLEISFCGIADNSFYVTIKHFIYANDHYI